MLGKSCGGLKVLGRGLWIKLLVVLGLRQS